MTPKDRLITIDSVMLEPDSVVRERLRQKGFCDATIDDYIEASKAGLRDAPKPESQSSVEMVASAVSLESPHDPWLDVDGGDRSYSSKGCGCVQVVSLPPTVYRAIVDSEADEMELPTEAPWLLSPLELDAMTPDHVRILRETKARTRSVSDEDFWKLVVPNGAECWGWSGPRNRGSPVFFVGMKSRTAKRHGWGLIHGSLPAGHAVLSGCKNTSCMNPDHWYAAPWATATGNNTRALCPLDFVKFRNLFSLNAYPMRILSKTFGLSEADGWAVVGYTKKRIAFDTDKEAERIVAQEAASEARKAALEEWTRKRALVLERRRIRAVRLADEEVVATRRREEKRAERESKREALRSWMEADKERRRLAREKARDERRREERAAAKADRHAAEKAKVAKYAAGFVLHCATCDKHVQVKSNATAEMEVLAQHLVRLSAKNDLTCAFCGSGLGCVEHEFLYSMPAKILDKHLTMHGMPVELGVRPLTKWVSEREEWRVGVELTIFCACKCGFEWSTPIRRWKTKEE